MGESTALVERGSVEVGVGFVGGAARPGLAGGDAWNGAWEPGMRESRVPLEWGLDNAAESGDWSMVSRESG